MRSIDLQEVVEVSLPNHLAPPVLSQAALPSSNAGNTGGPGGFGASGTAHRGPVHRAHGGDGASSSGAGPTSGARALQSRYCARGARALGSQG